MLLFCESPLLILLYCSQCYAQLVTTKRPQPYTSSARTSAPAIVTPGPRVEIRAVDSICGYWSTWVSAWTTHTIACSSGNPCVFSSVGDQVLGYCSQGNTQPITAAYDYGEGPLAGCGEGQLCCESALPSFGTYIFSNGASSMLSCGTTRFWQTAMATLASPSPTPTSSSSSSMTPSNTNAASGNSSGKLTTTNIITIVASVLGGTGTFIAAVIGILKYRQRKRAGQGADGGTGGNGVALLHRTGTDRGQNHYHLHFNDRVNVAFHNSELYLTGGQGGQGSNMRLSGVTYPPRIARGSSSRLLEL